MTVLICLGPTPDTWWQAKNAIGDRVLSRAETLARDDDVRSVVFEAKISQALILYELESELRGRVWDVVEEAARSIVTADPTDWPHETIAHVDDLAREMEALRVQPDRPGAWP